MYYLPNISYDPKIRVVIHVYLKNDCVIYSKEIHHR
uniref:Bm607 n=1 Tax=Brugia malayi TaxID=6279 RepID=A0A1I9G429_BRUMA|nr:Bm607 [Brugia malayi]